MQSITPPAPLKGSHLRTYEKIFQHPVPHNLAWRDVLALFNNLGEVVVEANGNLKIAINGQALVLPAPHTKEVAEVDELVKLRHFLTLAEAAPVEAKQTVGLMLVVIDQHKARLFRTDMLGASPRLILHYEPEDSFRQAHDARDYFNGKEKAAPNNYFEPVAQALKCASQILIFGHGTGSSNEMEQFTAWLKKHYPNLAARITDTVAVDTHHLTEAQMLAKARAL